MDNASDLASEVYSADDAVTSSGAGQSSTEFIPDSYLNRAIGLCCTDGYDRLLLSKPVRALISRYAPAERPWMNCIPQERRRKFLNELASITGRALPPRELILAEPNAPPEKLLQTDSAVALRHESPQSPEELFRAAPTITPGASTLAGVTSVSQDEKLILNGYEPIAVNGKVPVAKGWNKRSSTIEAISTERAAHPGAPNTGLRTGRLVGVDIDIVPAEHVQAIKRLAAEVLGASALERVGAKGAMLCYRNETPIGKITVSGKHSTQAGKVEILGIGQQFVAYGMHPDTGKPYVWTNALLDGEPLTAPLDKLPEVTPNSLRDFAERAASVMAELGYTDVKVSGIGAAAESVRLDAPVNTELDSPLNVQRARDLLRDLIDRGDVAVEGQGGDNRTYKVACKLRDLGLSPRTALELLLELGGRNEHCRPPWERNELAAKVRNAYNYGKNAPGVDAIYFPPLDSSQPVPPLEWPQVAPTLELPRPAATGATASPLPNNLVERFRGRWPDEYEALPELNFWDPDKTLPRSPDGCIAIVYGEFGSHKTNTILAMVLDAVLDQGALVCYAAGEGAYGVGKHRLPAHCAAREITTKDLRGRLRLVPAVPLFMAANDVTAFIEAQQDFMPNIVVLDTLATALAGEDENSSKAAAFLTANGPAGQIRDTFKALVILPAHQGKDASKRVRGHSGLMGNVDVVLHVEANKAVGAIKVTVEKMRDGRDGFSIFFKVPPEGSEGVPVPQRITKEEYLALTGSPSGGTRSTDAELTFNQRRDTLVEHRAVSFESGLSETQFAEMLVGERPRDDEVEVLAHWKSEVERERISLKNAHGKLSYKGVLCDKQLPAGYDKEQWRWFIVKPEPSNTAAGLDSAAVVDPATLFGANDHGNGTQDGALAAGYPS
jgi:Bifunctional DNA primase/polymerase, N-terminal/AAA domain